MTLLVRRMGDSRKGPFHPELLGGKLSKLGRKAMTMERRRGAPIPRSPSHMLAGMNCEHIRVPLEDHYDEGKPDTYD